MKKSLYLTLSVLILLPLLLCACTGEDEKPSARTPVYDADGVYAGFSDIPEDYNIWSAYDDKCLSIDISIEVDQKRLTAGRAHWQDFLDATTRGENAFLRVAHFTKGVGSYTDLYYCDGKYITFHLDERGITHGHPFLYLRKLEPNGIYDFAGPYYVLTDSMELTHRDVTWTYISSNLSTITKIPYEWLSFMIYFE